MQALQRIKKLWKVFVALNLFLFVMIILIRGWVNFQQSLSSSLFFALSVGVIFCLLVGSLVLAPHFLNRKRVSQLDFSNMEQVFSVTDSVFVAAYVMVTGISLTGFLLSLSVKRNVMLPYLMLSLLLFFYHYPTKKRALFYLKKTKW